MVLSAAAVIPARDEAATLAETLRALQNIPNLTRIIVADDGSRDATPEIARRLDAELLCASLPGRSGGKGHAIRLGLLRAREREPDAVLLADADLGPSAARLAAFFATLDEHHPIVVAIFPPTGTEGGLGLVKTFSRRAVLRRTGYCPSEPLSGQRALLTPLLATLPGIAPGFGAEVGMTLDLLSTGVKPCEIPLPLTHRPTGRNFSGFTHRARQGLDVVRALRGDRIPW